jgi:hypothetical protein
MQPIVSIMSHSVVCGTSLICTGSIRFDSFAPKSNMNLMFSSLICLVLIHAKLRETPAWSHLRLCGPYAANQLGQT